MIFKINFSKKNPVIEKITMDTQKTMKGTSRVEG